MAPPELHRIYTGLLVWNGATQYVGMVLVQNVGAEIRAVVCGHKILFAVDPRCATW